MPTAPASASQPASPTLDAPSVAPQAGTTQDPGDADKAAGLADNYERALVDGRWQAAWDMLSPADQALRGTFADYTSERSAYFHSVAGRYTLSAPTHDAAVLTNWTSSPDLVRGADLSRAFIVQADYPALAGNNAGFEVLLVAPGSSGAWQIWVVR